MFSSPVSAAGWRVPVVFLAIIGIALFITNDVEANEAPTASIDSVFPNPIYQNQSVAWNTVGSGTVGYWPLDNGVGTTAYDYSGNENHGTLYNGPVWVDGINGKALEFDGSNDYVKITGVDVNTAGGAKNTVDFWMYWDGRYGAMPFSWNVAYDLYFASSCLGFNTGNSDLLGFSPSGLENRWVHVGAVFYNGVPSSTQNELYINGEKQSLSACTSNGGVSRTVTSNSFIAAFSQNSNYKFSGIIDEVRIHNSAVNVTELYPTSNRTFFYGTGTDSDGTVANYTWSSSKDGVLSHSRNDTIYATNLSLGNHTISFKVQDNNGTWSDEDITYLTVKSFPTANVVSISPNPAHEGTQVNFTGTGTDSDGNIVGYQWRSSLDGVLSANASFSNSSLSYGNHSIYFKVRDNESLWSEEVLAYLYVNAKPVANIDLILPFEAYRNPGSFEDDLDVWRYVRPVHINPITPEDEYQVAVILNTTNFDYGKMNNSGADIRFFDSGLNELSYYTDVWNPEGESTIWVRIPEMGTRYLYLIYGNPKAQSKSNLTQTFEEYNEVQTKSGSTKGGVLYFDYPSDSGLRLMVEDSMVDMKFAGDFGYCFSYPSLLCEYVDVYHNGVKRAILMNDDGCSLARHGNGYPKNTNKVRENGGTLRITADASDDVDTSNGCGWYYKYQFTVTGYVRKYSGPEPFASIGQEVSVLTESITFNGSGFDPDGNITTIEWYSSLDGLLSTDFNFSLNPNELSAGLHNITLRIESENGIWSIPDYINLNITHFPIAVIDSITPGRALEGAEILFEGSGITSDSTIVAYNWKSSIDGNLSTQRNFSLANLSYGNHTINFRVKNDEGFWSAYVLEYLVINSVPSVEIDSISPNPAFQGEGGLFPESTLNWDYSRVITLSEPTILDNYPVRLDFNHSSFDFEHVLPNGEDIRFYDNNGNELNYWIQIWDASTTSIVWVSVPDSGTDRLVMQYGKSSALAMSNGSKVFSNYYDFESGFDGWTYYETDYHFGYERKELETDSQEYVLELRLRNNNNVEAWEYCEYRKLITLPDDQNLIIGFSETDNKGNQVSSSVISKRFRIEPDNLFAEYVTSEAPPYNWTHHEVNVSDYGGQEVTLRWRLILPTEVWNVNIEVYLDWVYLRYDDGQNLTATIGPEISIDSIRLAGSAIDLDGEITHYFWNSSLDGVIGTERNLSVDPDSLSLGTHNITFTARDDFGSWAPEVSGQLTVKSFPIATIESITPNPVPFGEPVSFSGSGDDPDGAIMSYLWRSDLDGILSTSVSFTTSSLSNGNHTIFFNVQDNERLWGKEVSIQLRVNLIPTATIQSSDDWLTEGDTFSAAGSASDADGEVIEHQWISSIDGIIADTQSVAYDGLSNGTHLITYRVMDNDGHWSQNVSASVTVNGIPRITGVDYPQLINEGGTAFFNLSYYDDDFVDAFEWISDRDGLIGSSASFQMEAGTALTNGTHDITVRVRDNFGVWSEYSHIAMRVNGIPRTEPLVELSHSLIEGDSVNLTINAADDVQVASIEWDVDGAVSTGNDYLLLDSLANGSHTVRVRANDGDGAWSSYTVFTLFINGIPRGAIIEPPEIWLTGDELVIQGTGSDDGEELVFRWVYLNDTYFGESITIVHSASESVKISLTLIDEYNTSSSESNWTILFHHRPTATIVSADTVSNHTVLQVVGEGNDDGTITMYHWVSDVDGSLGVGPSLSFYSMSVGYRNVSLTVKDNHEIWSYPVSTQVYIDDGDNLFPPADLFPFDPTQWFDRDGDGWGDNPKGNHSDAFPDDPTEWLDTDGDGIGDNTDLFVSVPNNYVYASISLVVLAGAAVILESRTRGNLDNLRSELQSVIDAGLNRKVATAALESLDDVGGIYLLSAEIRTARRAVREGRKHERDVVAIMEQMTALRNDIAAMKAENIDASEYIAILEELELALVQQSQENPSYEYIANLQEKWVEQEGEE